MKYRNTIKYSISGVWLLGPPGLVIEDSLCGQELQRQREVKKAEWEKDLEPIPLLLHLLVLLLCHLWLLPRVSCNMETENGMGHKYN